MRTRITAGEAAGISLLLVTPLPERKEVAERIFRSINLTPAANETIVRLFKLDNKHD